MNQEKTLYASIGALILLLIIFASTYYVGLVAVLGVNAIVVIGLAFLMATGQVSLGHAAFLGLGAYVSALLTMRAGVPVFLAIACATLACALVGYILAKLTLQLKGHYLPLATLAYGIAISVCFVGAMDLTGGASGLSGVQPITLFGHGFNTRETALTIWVVIALLVIGYRRIYQGRIGRVARAFKNNHIMASAFGVNVSTIRTQIFVLSAALGGLAGALYGCYMQFLSPSAFSLEASINLLIMAVLGGTAGPLGAVLGCMIFTGVDLAAQYVIATLLHLPGQVETMVFGAGLIVILLKWPNGLLFREGSSRPGLTRPNDGSNHSQRPIGAVRPPATLVVRNVTMKFGGLTALSDVNMSVPSRSIVGLIGPNGAGKSTLFNVLTQVLKASGGEVSLNGQALPKHFPDVVRKGISRTFQHVQLVQDMDVLQNVMIGGYINGRSGLFSSALGLDKSEEAQLAKEAKLALARVGLLDVAGKKVSELPLGSQRLVEVARALMARPSMLLLDEPAAGLRVAEKERLSNLLKSLRDEDGMTVLIVEHDMELVMGCADHLFVLNFGNLLAQGTPVEVQKNPDVINAYLGSEI